jgi:hypothetical protein
VANGSEFQERVRQLGKLIAQFEEMPEGSQKVACKELVQLLMDLHGAGLERMMEIIFESGDGAQKLIDKLGEDSVAGSLLLLYSLHPDDLETRLNRAIERMRPRLRKLSCSAEISSVNEGRVKIHVSKAGHSCGSSSHEVSALVEEGVFELAPDVVSVEILGLEDPPAGGFVALESLLGNGIMATASNGHVAESVD